MAETRARRRIRKAVESRGYRLVSLEWEPWGMAAEKEGIPGGWYGVTEGGSTDHGPDCEVMGLSVEEVLAWIDEYHEPPEPCGCTKPERSPVLSGANGRPNHETACRWSIAYHLPWWVGGEETGRGE